MIAGQVKNVSRDRDDRVLRILRLIRAGHSQNAVARHVGATRPEVTTIIKRVLADDLKYSGDPEDVVRSGYVAMRLA